MWILQPENLTIESNTVYNVVNDYEQFLNKLADAITQAIEIETLTRTNYHTGHLHGIKNKQNALDDYYEINCQRVGKYGLIICKNYNFSGDGLVVVEIKCLCNAIDVDLNNFKWKFFNKYQTNINLNHDFYYQTQGFILLSGLLWSDSILYI